MEDKKKDTLTEIWLRKIKNNPLVAGLIIFSITFAGVATFTESASKLYRLIIPTSTHEAKIPSTLTYSVEIMALPSTVNHGAKVNPHGVTLELYSDGSIQGIGVLNYPIQKQFMWSPKTGEKVVLRVSIGDLVLIKEYSGHLGFPEFLSEFSTGNRIFRPKEFDENHSITLQNLGVEFISVSFGIKGAEPVMKYLSN